MKKNINRPFGTVTLDGQIKGKIKKWKIYQTRPTLVGEPVVDENGIQHETNEPAGDANWFGSVYLMEWDPDIESKEMDISVPVFDNKTGQLHGYYKGKGKLAKQSKVTGKYMITGIGKIEHSH